MIYMGVSTRRKTKHKMDLIGEKEKYDNGCCDYTKINKKKLQKGQKTLI